MADLFGNNLCLQIDKLQALGATDSIAAALDTMLIRLHTAVDDTEAVAAVEGRLKQNPKSTEMESESIDNVIRVLRVFPDLKSLQ